MTDPTDPVAAARAAAALSDQGAHLALGAAAVGAAVLRLATYSGPPRPWRAVVLDTLVQLGTAVGVGELVLGTLGPAQAVGAGLLSGVVGWEVLKRVAVQRMKR